MACADWPRAHPPGRWDGRPAQIWLFPSRAVRTESRVTSGEVRAEGRRARSAPRSALRQPALQRSKGPETRAEGRPRAELGGHRPPRPRADRVHPHQAPPGSRRLCVLPGVKFQKSGWNVSGFCSHGYCRRRGGDRTKETRACGEGVLWFNEGLTRGLQVLPALPLPCPGPGPVFSSLIPSSSPPRPAPVLCEERMECQRGTP